MKLAFIKFKFFLITLTLSWTNSHLLHSSANDFCNSNGTLRKSIDGLCECKETVFGSFCDECKVGYFNLNENGCSKCFCFAGHHYSGANTRAQANLLNNKKLDEQIRCDSARNLFATKIETDFSKAINETWRLIEFKVHAKGSRFDTNEILDKVNSEIDSFENDLKTKHNILSSTRRSNFIEFVSEEPENDKVHYWMLGKQYRGNLIDSYDHRLKLEVFYSILRGDVSTDTFPYFRRWSDLILISKVANHTISIGCKWFNHASEFESDKRNVLEMIMNERNWFKLDSSYMLTDRKVDRALFELLLMRIEHFLVRAKYHTDQIESRIYQVQLEQSSLMALNSELSSSQSDNKLLSRVIKENCTCSKPFSGMRCDQCENGYFMVIHYKNKLTRRYKKEFLLECRPCPCKVCDVTGKCLCDHSTQGVHCEECRDGYQMTLNGCQKKSFLNESSGDLCCRRLINSMDKFDFERKFEMTNLKAIKLKPFKMLTDLQMKHNQLKVRSEQQITRLQLPVFEYFQHQTGDDILKPLNKTWLLNKLHLEQLKSNLSSKMKSSVDLRLKSEQVIEKLINFRGEINFQIDRLVTLKYQTLFKQQEMRIFHQETGVLLKRLKKEFREERLISGLKRQIDESNGLYQNVSIMSTNILMYKNELIEQFERLFRVETGVRQVKNYIETDLETKIDFVVQLIDRLNSQLAKIEQLNNDAENEQVAIEQLIVDAHYINGISHLIIDKLGDQYFDFQNNLNKLNQRSYDDLYERYVRQHPENEVKYSQMCEIHVSTLKENLIAMKRTLNDEQVNREFVHNFIFNQTILLNTLRSSINQLKDIDLYLESSFDSNELDQQIRILKKDENFNNKSHQFIEMVNEINSSMYEMADRLESTKRRIETVQSKMFIIDQLDNNVEQRNELLMSVEQDLQNLTRRSIIAKYMDNLPISPVIEIKIFEHESTLATLNNALLPEYSRRLGELKQELNLPTLNNTLDDQIQQIHNNVEIRKQYVESFELRNRKMKSLIQKTEMTGTKIDQQIRQAKNILANVKLNLAMNYDQVDNCRRIILLDNLVASSSIDIEFDYSVGHLKHDSSHRSADQLENPQLDILRHQAKTINIDNHTIFMIGKPGEHFVRFELMNGQMKVAWNFQNAKVVSQLIVPLRFRKNNPQFKNKNAYYKIKFVRIGQKCKLIVNSFDEGEFTETLFDNDDLIMKLEKKIRFGHSLDEPQSLAFEKMFIEQLKNQSNVQFTGVISDLKINGESIGLWRYEDSTDGCTPMKDVLNNDGNQPDFFLFDGRNSYLSLRQINRYEKSRYSIRMVFRTFASDGLLFISFNEANNDRILIQLQNAHLRLVISAKQYESELITNQTYNDGYMYTIMIERENYFAILSTDLEQLEGHLKRNQDRGVNISDEMNNSKSIESTFLTNSKTKLEMDLENSSIFIGGLPADQIEKNHLVFKPFNGCIKRLQVETVQINLNNQDSFGVHGSSSSNLIKQMNFYSSNSYIKFSDLSLKNLINFGFTFRTILSNCSILSLTSSQKFNGTNSVDRREILLNLVNDKLVFTVMAGDDFNSTLLNNQNYKLNNGDYHSIFLIKRQSSIKIMIDNDQQTEVLENFHFENLDQHIEQLSVLELGKLPDPQLDELNLDNRFIGSFRDFIMNNKLTNLDLHFETMRNVEILSS